MLKKIILTVFIAFIVFVLAFGYAFSNLKSESVYYAQHTPHSKQAEPVLMEVALNLDWIYTPDIKGIKYDYDGYRNIYNYNYAKREAPSFCFWASGEYEYFDGDSLNYVFDRKFKLVEVWNSDTLKRGSKNVDLAAVKKDIYRTVQPVIDAQSEPLINLQWLYDWVNKDRFN